jgi:S-formylglutathione hydrolase FrmB
MIEPSPFRFVPTLALIRALVIATLLAGTAVADTISPGVTDQEGIISHDVQSSRQSGPTQIRVLLPDSPKVKRHGVVYVLPVEAGTKTEFGDPLLELKRLDLHNRYNVIFVERTFFDTPWYADNPNDPGIQQESYLVKDVIPFIDRMYPTRARTEGRFLVGFSKSGWGACTLLLRHPQTFGRAAAWDAPMMMDQPGEWGSSPIFGTKQNFERYRVTNL